MGKMAAFGIVTELAPNATLGMVETRTAFRPIFARLVPPIGRNVEDFTGHDVEGVHEGSG